MPDVPAARRVVRVDEVVLADPHGLQRRRVSTRDRRPLDDDPALETPDAQLCAIPRHVRVIPRNPCQQSSARRQRGMREEVALIDERRHAGSVQGDAHDGTSRHRRPVVGLTDREQLSVLPSQPAEPHAAICRRQGAGLLTGLERPDALVLLLDEEQDAVIRRGPRASAVFVHAGSGVPRRRQDVVHRAVRAPSSHRSAAAFLRDALAPPDIVADEACTLDARRCGGHCCRRERRVPGAVGKRLGHESTVFRAASLRTLMRASAGGYPHMPSKVGTSTQSGTRTTRQQT